MKAFQNSFFFHFRVSFLGGNLKAFEVAILKQRSGMYDFI